jgi:hypothetical protein
MGFTKQNGCVIYKPANYDSAKQYPCILFLHGIGERGDGSTLQLDNVLNFLSSPYNNIIGSLEKSGNYLLVAPQLSASLSSWDISTIEKGMKEAAALNYNPKRLYIAGVSLGGGGVWKYLSITGNAGKFAAAAVICGVGGWTNLCNITCPVWAFHASDDNVVGVGNTISAVDGINACKPPVPARKTIYPTGQHYIWGRVFDPNASPGINGETVTLFGWFDLNQQGSPVAVPATVAPSTSPTAIPSISAVAEVKDITISTATLDGSKSSGNILWSSWKILKQPPGSDWNVFLPAFDNSGLVKNVRNLAPGDYTFELTIKTPTGIGIAPVTFTVGSAVSPVFVEAAIPAGKTKVIVRENKTVEFS